MSDHRLLNNELSFEKLLENEYPLKDVRYELNYEKKSENNKEIQVDDDNQKNKILYKIIKNLNSSDTEFKNQELRNRVYQCEFYDMLHSINNTNTKWREISP